MPWFSDIELYYIAVQSMSIGVFAFVLYFINMIVTSFDSSITTKLTFFLRETESGVCYVIDGLIFI